MSNMRHTSQGNCPFCDGERGIPTAWGMHPEDMARLKAQHDAGHPELQARPNICGALSDSGYHGETLACGMPKGHEGAHAWASLPTFTAEIVATVDKRSAIDMTPIYTLTLTKDLSKGSVLEFDAAEKVVRVSQML